MREKVFRNSSGFRFYVSFVNWTSVFVKSVLEAPLSFSYTLKIEAAALLLPKKDCSHSDHIPFPI